MLVRAVSLFAALSSVLTGQNLLDPEFWRQHAVRDLAPLWLRHAPDASSGAFHTSLSREWAPERPTEKVPAMVSRQVFGFSAAYQLSGDERYLKQAAAGAAYLLKNGWDSAYGGWYDRLTPAGEPLDTSKSTPQQLYTDVGLTMYYVTTGDKAALEKVQSSLDIRRTKGRDPRQPGYVQQLNRDLTVADYGKNKHAHYGYVGSLLLNLSLATHDPAVVAYSRELMDMSLGRMKGPGGWLQGFNTKFDREWKMGGDGSTAETGAQLTAALALFRLYDQTRDTKYLAAGEDLGTRVTAAAFNPATGAWIDRFEAVSPHKPLTDAAVQWWIQIYGSFLQLHLYRHTGEKKYLNNFEQSERFYTTRMLDEEHGGVIPAVTPEGTPSGRIRKASPWRTSFHELEHALLNFLYLNLYVHGRPATLHYRLHGPGSYTLTPVDAPGLRIRSVTADGKPWKRYNALLRTVSLPDAKPRTFKVVFELPPAASL